MPSHGTNELIVSKAFIESENGIKCKYSYFVFMVLIRRSRSSIKTGDLIWQISADLLARKTIFSLDKSFIYATRILWKSSKSRINIRHKPVNPRKSTYRNRITVLHDKRNTLSSFRDVGPRNRKRKGRNSLKFLDSEFSETSFDNVVCDTKASEIHHIF